MVGVRQFNESDVPETALAVFRRQGLHATSMLDLARGSGAAFTADLDGAAQPENVRFSFEVSGSDGWLSLIGDHPYGCQAGDLKLTSNIPIAPPTKPRSLAGSWARRSTWEGALARSGFAGCSLQRGWMLPFFRS